MYKRYGFIAILVIVLYTLSNLYCYPKLSPTGDEINYYAYAVNIVKGNPQKQFVNGKPQFNTQMPISVANTLPRMVQQVLQPSLKKDVTNAQQDIINGRLISIAISILLALYVLRWSTQLYGKAAGLFSLVILLLCPNIIAHSQFVGTDVYSFFIATAICYHVWRYNTTKDYLQLFYLALFLGIGQIAKQSLIVFYPIVFVLLFFAKTATVKQKFAFVGKAIAGIAIVSILVINIGFLFYKTGKPLGEYHFVSQKIVKVQNAFSCLKNLPIPMPEPYVQGFDFAAFNEETPPSIEGKSSYGQGYFLGKPVGGKPFYSYYIIGLAFKLPIATIIILLTSLVVYFIKRKSYAFTKAEIYLLLPAFVFLFFLSVSSTMYLGVRNVLLMMPLLFVFAGSLWKYITAYKWSKIGVGILLAWQLISVAKYFPHFIPYTNEFIWNKTNAYKVFGDANLFYQEGHCLVKNYLQKNADIQYEPTQPVKGKVLVSIEHYYDWWHLGKMKWLTELKLEPVGNFDSQFLLFDVK
ncbi:MAG: glycosyltransferase family 39 protein [Ferruginibacter sp.]|nr:glycosyltransferase family 39 protein [Ferruginibacter sp.]